GDARALWLRDILANKSARIPVDVAPADLAVLQYTGGTTGVPKGAMLSHRALVANVHQCQAWHASVAAGDRILAIMPFFHVYGLTEAAPVTHSNPREGVRKPGSVGLPLPDVDCKIVDIETGTREVGPGEAGELCLRGPNIMDGYWQRPDETAAVIRDGWLRTGDIVRMDEDGYFYVVDRVKEMIIVSGFKVYPREVDEVLYAHPAVLEAAAVGVPHPS